MKMMKMETLEDTPSESHIADPENVWMLPMEERKTLLLTIATSIVDQYVDMSFHVDEDYTYIDKVNLYARRLLSLGCFYMEYSDAIREGDGDRVLHCWRYMLPMFMSSGRKNYALESLNLLLQHDFILPPRQAAELIWGRFINVSGVQGRNIPNDLHLEHLNRVVKTTITNLGANKTEAGITRVGKVLRLLTPLLNNFDEDNRLPGVSAKHRKPSEEKDMKIVLRHLSSSFDVISNRAHPTFPNPRHPLYAVSSENLKTWINDHITKYYSIL